MIPDRFYPDVIFARDFLPLARTRLDKIRVRVRVLLVFGFQWNNDDPGMNSLPVQWIRSINRTVLKYTIVIEICYPTSRNHKNIRVRSTSLTSFWTTFFFFSSSIRNWTNSLHRSFTGSMT